jgi:hypothetical protein
MQYQPETCKIKKLLQLWRAAVIIEHYKSAIEGTIK